MYFDRAKFSISCLCAMQVFVSTVLSVLPARAESNNDLLKKAIVEYKSGDYNESAGHFYAVLTTEFNNPSVHYYMASCYVHMKDSESAVREFRIAYALSPSSDVGRYASTALKLFGVSHDDPAQSKAFLDEARSKRAAPPGLQTASGAPPLKDDGKAAPPQAPSAPPPVSAAAAVTDQSVSLIRSQAQREKSVRIEQSQKMANEINQKGTEHMDREVSAVGARLSSDPKQRERDISLLPDDVKSMLEKLKREYDNKKAQQLGLGKTQSDMLDESAANLQHLIEDDHSVQAAGSNLYVRNYSKGGANTSSKKKE